MSVASIGSATSTQALQLKQRQAIDSSSQTKPSQGKNTFDPEVIRPAAVDMTDLSPKMQAMREKIQRVEKYSPMMEAARHKMSALSSREMLPFIESSLQSAQTREKKALYEDSFFRTMKSISTSETMLRDKISHAQKHSYADSPDLMIEMTSGLDAMRTLEDADRIMREWTRKLNGEE